MLYSEFLSGTQCRDNDHNYRVYRDLEVLYMNSDKSKDEIYAYGVKLVDNTPSEESQKILREMIEKLNNEIRYHEEMIAYYKDRIEFYTYLEEEAEVKKYKRLRSQESRMLKAAKYNKRFVLAS